jgi:predicted nucleotidyltransferase
MRNQSSTSVKVFYRPFSREQLVEKQRQVMPQLTRQLPFRRAVLFGSWATNRATAFSDIDILVVYADPPRDDAYSIVRRVVNLRGLEPHMYAQSEAEALRPTLNRMTRSGIDLLDAPDAR